MADNDGEQVPLLDLSGKELNLNWVDKEQALFLPNNPLHWHAHKLQLLLAMLDKQASNPKTAPSFNAGNYMNVLNAYTETMQKIKKAADDETDDARDLAHSGDEGEAPTLGERKPAGVGVRVSADNPFAGSGADTL